MNGSAIRCPRGGRVIKFMGDTALMLFDESAVDTAVRSLLTVQTEGDRYLAGRNFPCRHRIRVHFGQIHFGPIGTRQDKRDDVLGPAVNTLFLLKGGNFVMTSEVFRKLEPATRKLFKKHTPPITYIPLAELHRD